MTHSPRIPFRLAMALLACQGGIALAAGAPAPKPADRLGVLEQRLAQSQKTIEELAAAVHALQAQLARQQVATAPATPAAVPPPTAASQDNERIAHVEREVEQITAAASAQRGDDRGLPLHGFADVGVGNHNPLSADLKGAAVGSVDFYLAPQLGAHTRALVELNFEVGEEGGVGVDLERTQLGYQMGNAGTAWVGRFHTPYDYYNTAFHHGQQISTSLRRPRFLAFEDQGGILPAHTTGLWFTGSQRTGGGKLSYDIYAGNAQHIAGGVLDMRQAGGNDGQVIAGGKLAYQFGGGLESLQLGVSALSGRIEDDSSAANDTHLNAFGLHAVWDSDNWENIAEVFLFRNQSLAGGGTHSSNAGFVQVGYRTGGWTPYARYERTSLDQADGYFAGQASGVSYHREAVGLRYDLDLKSSLKLELADTHFTDRTMLSYGDMLLQYAIRF
jgi:hypothetical protein